MSAHQRLGPFLTKVIYDHEDGHKTVATSRRCRKGLSPLLVRANGIILHPAHPASAWLHLWAPRKLGWWIAVLFFIGSAFFMIGAFFATWPHVFPGEPQQMNVLNWIFFIGSMFFTAAAYLQWLQSINGDVAQSVDGHTPKRWRWCAWKPRNLGFLASLIQLIGTIFFNFNTADAMIGGLNWEGQDLLIWSPNMAGCLCFLVASYLAYLEVSRRFWSWQPRNLSWWITVTNLWGSIFFQISAWYSFVPPAGLSDHAGWLAGFYTYLGAVCFLLGSYLLVPEMFEEGATQG